MEIVIYSIPGCSYCQKMKQLMDKAEVEYKQIIVGRDITNEEFKTNYPNVSSYPFTLIDNEPIGGLVDAVKLFVEKGLVSSKSKRDE